MTDTPLSILESLFDPLLTCARYADFLQQKVEALEEKSGSTNIFAAALSAADLSIQTSIEVALLSKLPHIPFFGEEWKSSPNTRYLAGTSFVKQTPYLITLDPIDGTRPYLDRHKLYQIIMTVITKDAMQAALVLFPAFGDYVYAVRGRGAFKADFSTPLSKAAPLKMGKNPSVGYLALELVQYKDRLKEHFEEVHCSADYSQSNEMRYTTSALRGELQGAVLESAQIIDGAALAFVAQEMGYIVQNRDGSEFRGSHEHVDQLLPGLIIAESEKVLRILKDVTGTPKP